MPNQTQTIQTEFEKDILGVKDRDSLQRVRLKYLGRKEGLLTKLFDELAGMPIEKKRELGPKLNQTRTQVEKALKEKEENLLSGQATELDFTLPGQELKQGHLHPITQIQKEIERVFLSLGFDIELGPEIESDYYNFEALNIPEDHPARDMQDTFYLDLEHPGKHPGKNMVLRTHISNMQVRYMEKHKPPFAVVLPGRVYRNEGVDASHEHTYQYMEGFVVGQNISFANMAWTLDRIVKEIFGKDVKTKILPSYFPFVEPGAELAISCLICKGYGCAVCKQSGWVEIGGCGMVHQKVFEYAGYKKNEYTGFAFGFGLSRFALMRYGIPNIRMFAENDLRFLNQF